MPSDAIPVNLPFERLPQHEADPGVGLVPPPPLPSIDPRRNKPEEPRDE